MSSLPSLVLLAIFLSQRESAGTNGSSSLHRLPYRDDGESAPETKDPQPTPGMGRALLDRVGRAFGCDVVGGPRSAWTPRQVQDDSRLVRARRCGFEIRGRHQGHQGFAVAAEDDAFSPIPGPVDQVGQLHSRRGSFSRLTYAMPYDSAR